MAKYPVELGDGPGQLDAINYLLSGTQGLGQSVQGFIGNTTSFQNGNTVAPFTANPASLYKVESIATVVWLDDYTLRFNFTVTESQPPFSLGNPITASGMTPTEYNGTFASVVVSTTSYVIVKSSTPIPNMGAGTGGTISLNSGLTNTFKYLHTDCFGFANVFGGQDIPVISAQLKNTIQYITQAETSLLYTAAINRYNLFPNGTFTFSGTVAYQAKTITLPSTLTAVTALTITGGSKPATTYPYTYSVTIGGAGTNLKLDITINASGAGVYDSSNTTITITNGGSGWSVGNIITILGTDLGGATPANDLTLTVSSVGSLSGSDYVTDYTYFTAVKDNPIPGSYIYFLDTSYYDSTGQTIISSAELGYRSLTAQVIKE